VQWGQVDTQLIGKDACIIDFGESFEATKPPENLGVPGPYRSPELILDRKASIGSDLWALGCSLFEVRTGRKLFDSLDDDDDEYLDGLVQVLGKLPEPWWATTWVNRKTFYENDEIEIEPRAAVIFSENGTISTGRSNSFVLPSVAEGARSLKDKLAPGLWYMPEKLPDSHREILETEIEIFVDLLQRLLEYKPEERISAADTAHHGWFEM
jgi:serine/threonine protein kinase